ncbi:MAG: hypothetical protein OXH76_01265 [Boseongicola sp.]|nr:hypothetical protein [Boseongicola sp.]
MGLANVGLIVSYASGTLSSSSVDKIELDIPLTGEGICKDSKIVDFAKLQEVKAEWLKQYCLATTVAIRGAEAKERLTTRRDIWPEEFWPSN